MLVVLCNYNGRSEFQLRVSVIFVKMVAAVSEAANPRTPPLLPSEKDSNGCNKNIKRPKARVVASRYLTPSPPTPSSNSSSTPRRFTPPLSNSPPFRPKRHVAVDRGRSGVSRPLKPDLDLNVSNGSEASLLITSSRSLSVSFQGEAFSLPISKTKVAPPPPPSPNLSSIKKNTPERRRTGTRLRGNGDGGRDQVEDSKPSECRFSLIMGNVDSLWVDEISVNKESFLPSDTDSISSGSTSGNQECGRTLHGQTAPCGMVSSAKFWQETNSRLRRLQKLTSSGPKMVLQPASLKKQPSRVLMASPISGMQSPSVLSYAVDVRRGKVGENRIFDAHLLRLLYNRHLQWRFINASAETSLVLQTHTAEKDLWNSWIRISELRDTVTKRRHRLQLLRQKLKLASILKGQISCLENWDLLDKEHSVSVHGVTESLKANTLRLPIVSRAIADIQSLKEAISSAVDVMQAMGSSICSLLTKVEEASESVTALTKVATKERALLEQCNDFLSILAIMQVKECTLRTNILQTKSQTRPV